MFAQLTFDADPIAAGVAVAALVVFALVSSFRSSFFGNGGKR